VDVFDNRRQTKSFEQKTEDSQIKRRKAIEGEEETDGGQRWTSDWCNCE